MPKQKMMITGYQYSPTTNAFIGEYQFPNNEDKDEIHMPPYTTLDAPPRCQAGEWPTWDGTKWVIAQDTNLSGIKAHGGEDKIDFAAITDDFVAEMKSHGLWSAEHNRRHAAAAKARAAHRAEMAQRHQDRLGYEGLRRNFHADHPPGDAPVPPNLAPPPPTPPADTAPAAPAAGGAV